MTVFFSFAIVRLISRWPTSESWRPSVTARRSNAAPATCFCLPPNRPRAPHQRAGILRQKTRSKPRPPSRSRAPVPARPDSPRRAKWSCPTGASSPTTARTTSPSCTGPRPWRHRTTSDRCACSRASGSAKPNAAWRTTMWRRRASSGHAISAPCCRSRMRSYAIRSGANASIHRTLAGGWAQGALPRKYRGVTRT